MSSPRPEHMAEAVDRVQNSLVLGTVVVGRHVTTRLPTEIEPALSSLPRGQLPLPDGYGAVRGGTAARS
ncbi:hypothetical protein EBF04_15820 [Streptomyces sp. I6]|nr:hypothetical protein EBF04_15820 [Streptomyces sp. I6]